MSSTEKNLKFGERKITLIGTAHVSAESVQEVKNSIEKNAPDCVAIELDSARYESMTNPEAYKNLDIISVLKKGKALVVLANLVLGSFQRRMGDNVGVKPGDELKAAVDCAKEKNIPFELVDRPIQVTLNRAWAMNSFWGKCKLLAVLISSAFDNEKISSEEIESLKQQNEMDSMMGDLAKYLPKVKQVLIDERDFYLASHIWNAKGNSITAVLGAGHLPGVQSHLERFAAGTESTDTSAIENVPPKGIFSKLLGWLIPAAIVALIAFGFYLGGREAGSKMILSWVIWNGALSAIGAIAAAAHPFAVIASFVGAPVTSLCPFIGVGFVSGIVQALSCKPKVSDMESLQSDATSVKGFYSNRITRVLIVFVLSSLGSSIGTFVAGSSFVKVIADLFR